MPGDKSISHRALIFALMAEGETIVSGLLDSADVLATAAAVRQLGGRIIRDGNLWRVHGCGTRGLKEPEDILDMDNSGTGARLLAGAVAGYGITAVLTGDASLRRRPMKRIIDPLTLMGAHFTARGDALLPFALKGSQNLRAIDYIMPVASAQVKSAILLAALNAEGTTKITEPLATRDHTENMMRLFGATLETSTADGGENMVVLPGGQKLSGCAIDIPGDPSSAAFAVAAACLIAGSDVTLPGICVNQRRAGFYRALQKMGADISFVRPRCVAGEDIADIHVKYAGPLCGTVLVPADVPDMIDECPLLAIVAACARGTTIMRGLAELKVKESNRLALVATGIAACGGNIRAGDDSLTIEGAGKPLRGGTLVETAMDHRIAMGFIVLGMAAENPVTIDDSRFIGTSFPGFTDLMSGLGAQITLADAADVYRTAMAQEIPQAGIKGTA